LEERVRQRAETRDALAPVELIALAVVGREVEHVADASLDEGRHLEPARRARVLGEAVDAERAFGVAHRDAPKNDGAELRRAHVDLETKRPIEALSDLLDRPLHDLVERESDHEHSVTAECSRRKPE